MVTALFTDTASRIGSAVGRVNPLRLPNTKEAPEVLDPASDESFQKIKTFNTETGQKTNFWRETAGYLRWGALALMAGTFTAIGAALGISGWFSTEALDAEALQAAEKGASAAKEALWGLIPGTAAVGGAAIASSQYATKVASDRYIDVRNYEVMRQASLTGKAVVNEIKEEMHNARAASMPDVTHTHEFKQAKDGSWAQRIETTRIESALQEPSRS